MAAKGAIYPVRSDTNVPDDMDLIINFLGLGALLNESHHSLESRRVMEDKSWVALEGE